MSAFLPFFCQERKQNLGQLTIVLDTGSSNVSTPEYLVSTCTPPTSCLLAVLDAPWEEEEELPMLPETVGETGRPALDAVGGGASCSGTNWARPLPLSCTEGCCTIPGWVNPGMLSSSKSSSSSITREGGG